MGTVSRTAAELAVGFRLGLVTQAEIVSWADSVIANSNEPPDSAIDLALMGKAHAQDVLGKLGELSGDVGPVEALPLALKRFAPRLHQSPTLGPTVAKGLLDIFVQSGNNVPRDLNEIGGFDEDYWLARNDGYGTESDVYGRLLEFFNRFEHVV